jgi:hypothetical protein
LNDYPERKNRYLVHFENTQRILEAIDSQVRTAKPQSDQPEVGKSQYTTIIRVQESHIQSLEDQIRYLEQRMEQQSHSSTEGQSELERILQWQDTQIGSLERQISQLITNSVDPNIPSLEQNHTAVRNQQTKALEAKLKSLRKAQISHKIQASVLRTSLLSQDLPTCRRNK